MGKQGGIGLGVKLRVDGYQCDMSYMTISGTYCYPGTQKIKHESIETSFVVCDEFRGEWLQMNALAAARTLIPHLYYYLLSLNFPEFLYANLCCD